MTTPTEIVHWKSLLNMAKAKAGLLKFRRCVIYHLPWLQLFAGPVFFFFFSFRFICILSVLNLSNGKEKISV